jgi:hypothetical protein
MGIAGASLRSTRRAAGRESVHVLGATVDGVASWLHDAGFGGGTEDALRETVEAARGRMKRRAVAVVLVDFEGVVAFVALEVDRTSVNVRGCGSA